MTLSLILLLAFWMAPTPTESWQCRNDLEIRCSAGNCEAEREGDFTPVSVTFDAAGAMRVCAYSGCWEGNGTVVKSGDFVILTGQNLTFSTAPESAEMKESIVITLDRADRVAVLKAGAFAHPLLCEQGAQE